MLSFVMRVRDEARTLERSLRSLAPLVDADLAHEIVVVLNRCTDESAAIAERVGRDQPLQISSYGHALSRAGVECLATDATSPHSLVAYYEHAFGLARYPWKFKWDGDFVASPALLAFLAGELSELSGWEGLTRVRMPCVYEVPVDGRTISNDEEYLSNAILRFGKHVFWEIALHDSRSRSIFRADCTIAHASSLLERKAYWDEPPWFETEDSREARLVAERVRAVTEIVGIAPPAVARASDPRCDAYYARLMAAQLSLERRGVRFYE